jgi:hypothetical protein
MALSTKVYLGCGKVVVAEADGLAYQRFTLDGVR